MQRNGPSATEAPQFRPINPEALSTLFGHRKHVTALTSLPDGRLVSGSHDDDIKVWDVVQGSCEATLYGHRKQVSSLALLPDGRLASGSADQTIKIWDVAHKNCVTTLSGHTNTVLALAVLPDGRLASGSGDKLIKVWDVVSQRCEATLSGHTNPVAALTLLSDGRLASGSWDHSIKIWNVVSQRCEATLSGHTNHVNVLTLLLDGRLASGSNDKTIKVWDVARTKCVATLSRRTGSVNDLTVLPNGRLASGSDDNSIKLWDEVPGLMYGTRWRCEVTLLGHTDIINALTLLPDGRLASGAGDKAIKIWDLGLRPVPMQQAVSLIRAGAGTEKKVTENAVREAGHVSPPAHAQKAIFPPKPPKSAAKKVASEVSERDHLPELSALSLSQVAGTISFDELEIGRKLGQGGFGVVNEALWQGATVAVKQLLGQLTPDLIDEFQRETAVHASLRHPNIILLYGICIEATKCAMVMEFMANGSLYDVLKNPAELPWSRRLSLALEITAGLVYLQGKQIIHRDLKSLNILVDDRMHAKVSDFGLSKIKLTTASMTKGGGGTTQWEAPELFDEAPNSPATDVYATGIVFWEIAARKVPYEGKTKSQIIHYVDSGKRETIPTDTPAPFSALMTRCWAQRAEDRPTIIDVAKDMRAMTSNASSSSKVTSNSPTNSGLDSGYEAFSRR